MIKNEQKAKALYATSAGSFIGWLLYTFGWSGVLFVAALVALYLADTFDGKEDAQ
jgi:hypothetical protein